jgi:sugar lactone lactonase YvrE
MRSRNVNSSDSGWSMMKQLLCFLVLTMFGATAQAHPGVGIVADSRGNVFFTDLKQVWKITPDGKLTVAVPDVHSHELCLDAKENLYGEHYWHDSQTKKWMRRVWCLKSDGGLTEILTAREGYLRDYGFVRDRMGNMYWLDRGETLVLKRRSPDGTSTPHGAAALHNAEWMTVATDGTLFLMDGGDLRRVSPDGKVTTVAARLSDMEIPPVGVSERNYHMGLWTDADGKVYVAVARERLVLRLEPGGKPEVVARSQEPWSPSGGTFDHDGKLWLLEYDSRNAVRARRIDREGRERIFPAETPR